MKRRRFLSIAAAFAAAPAAAEAVPNRWRGIALGAEAEIVLYGDRAAAVAAFATIAEVLAAVERSFSLYDPASELAELNRTGVLRMSDRFAQLVRVAGHMNTATDGLFDPTVQPVWRALSERSRPPYEAVGWNRVQVSDADLRLGPGQALTFNGIAQGFATDLVADALRSEGFTQVLVNIGEFSGHGRDWRIGLSDPVLGHLGTRTLRDGAIATSSPDAMQVGPGGHILHPWGGPVRWSTVSVEAGSAALADGLSTALCLADAETVTTIRSRLPDVRRITLVDTEGNLRTLT